MDDGDIVCMLKSSGRSLATRVLLLILVAKSSKHLLIPRIHRCFRALQRLQRVRDECWKDDWDRNI